VQEMTEGRFWRMWSSELQNGNCWYAAAPKTSAKIRKIRYLSGIPAGAPKVHEVFYENCRGGWAHGDREKMILIEDVEWRFEARCELTQGRIGWEYQLVKSYAGNGMG